MPGKCDGRLPLLLSAGSGAVPRQHGVHQHYVQPGRLLRRGECGSGRELSVQRHLQGADVQRQYGLRSGGQVGGRHCGVV